MKDKKLFFEVITPERTVVSEMAVNFVVVRSVEKDNDLGSELGIYPYHAPMLAKIPTGAIRYEKNDKVYFLVAAGGFLEVKNNRITIVSLAAEKVKRVDMEIAKVAKLKADKWLEEIAGKAAFDEKAAEVEVKRAMVGFYKTSSRE